jgi:SAM-dependent methyltransferase
MSGKRVLGMRLDDADKILLEKFVGGPIKTFDMMPRHAPDVIANLSRPMGQPAESFDIIYCNGILSTVRDLDAALRNIKRLLSPNGVFYLYETTSIGVATREITDLAEIKALYGAENLEKYDVGRFRRFGMSDLLAKLKRLFAVEVLETSDPVSGVKFYWVVAANGALPAEPFMSRKEQLRFSTYIRTPGKPGKPPFTCSLCNTVFDACKDTEDCPCCGEASRTRSLPAIVTHHLPKILDADLAKALPVLGFAVTGTEYDWLKRCFGSIYVVSLYGERRWLRLVPSSLKQHIGSIVGVSRYGGILGVDARDLSRFASNSFCGVFSIGVYDFFAEQEQALAEAFRVTAPAGVFLTLIQPHRLRPDDEGPVVTELIRGRSGWQSYLPRDVDLPSITVGRDWYVKAMQEAGYEATAVEILDEASGITNTWFLGKKPSTGAVRAY